MANGNGDRQVFPVVAGVIGLLVTVVGGAFSLQARVAEDVRTTLAAELKHVVTRAELSEMQRKQEGFEVRWRLDVLRRLDRIDEQLKELRRGR